MSVIGDIPFPNVSDRRGSRTPFFRLGAEGLSFVHVRSAGPSWDMRSIYFIPPFFFFHAEYIISMPLFFLSLTSLRNSLTRRFSLASFFLDIG